MLSLGNLDDLRGDPIPVESSGRTQKFFARYGFARLIAGRELKPLTRKGLPNRPGPAARLWATVTQGSVPMGVAMGGPSVYFSPIEMATEVVVRPGRSTGGVPQAVPARSESWSMTASTIIFFELVYSVASARYSIACR